MAAMDKIYGNKKQYNQLMKFYEDNFDDYKSFTGLDYIRKYDYTPKELKTYKKDDELPIVNQEVIADTWLILRCNFDWVIDQLKDMYNCDDYFKIDMIENLKNNVQNDFCQSLIEHKKAEREMYRINKLCEKE